MHGSGEQVPGPRFAPPAESQAPGDSTLHVNAPAGDDVGTQHWTSASTMDVDVDVLVVEVEVLVVDTMAAHGSGAHVPGPSLMPLTTSQVAGGRISQLNAPDTDVIAPETDVGTQHWTSASTMDVDVDDDVDVDVVLTTADELVDVDVDVLVVESPLHASGAHGPGPTLAPPAEPQAPGDSSLHVNAPETDVGRQHWIVPETVLDVDDEVDVDVVWMATEELVEVDVLVVVTLAAHASGEHAPGPMFAPPAEPQAPGDSSLHVNAPETDVGRQQRISPAIDVDVEDVVDVVVRLTVLVVTPTQGSGEQVPGPRFAPPAESQAAGESSLHVKTSQPGIGRQHWIVATSEVDVEDDVVVVV